MLVVFVGIVIICSIMFVFFVVFCLVLSFERVLSSCLLCFECVLFFCSAFRMWNVVMKGGICMLVVPVGFVIICVRIIMRFRTWSYFVSVCVCVCVFFQILLCFFFLCFFWSSLNVYVG